MRGGDDFRHRALRFKVHRRTVADDRSLPITRTSQDRRRPIVLFVLNVVQDDGSVNVLLHVVEQAGHEVLCGTQGGDDVFQCSPVTAVVTEAFHFDDRAAVESVTFRFGDPRHVCAADNVHHAGRQNRPTLILAGQQRIAESHPPKGRIEVPDFLQEFGVVHLPNRAMR